MHAARGRRRHHPLTGVPPADERRLAVELLLAVIAVAGLFVVVPVLARGPQSVPEFLFPLLWVVVSIVFALRAARHVVRVVRRARMLGRERHGRCDRCGYDLAHLHSRRCPECGTYVHRMRLHLAPKEHGRSLTPRH